MAHQVWGLSSQESFISHENLLTVLRSVFERRSRSSPKYHLAEQGVGFQPEASGSFLKSELVK